MTKVCCGCNIEKELTEFHKKKGGHQGMCKDCRKVYIRNHYIKNKEKYMEKAAKCTKENRKWYREYKDTLRCTLCGENHPACLEFHHRDRETKAEEPSRLIIYGKKRFLKEIEKCDVLCSNCHRKLHHNERLASKKDE